MLRHFVRAYSTSVATTKHLLRDVLRETAQPVAVVTSFMPADASGAKFHGATLSSFTSIAMDPVPLVSFALRIPSRMAQSLNESASGHMVVNLLAQTQAHTAMVFSRADAFPRPFLSTEHTLSAEGLPIISGSVGALTCKLVSNGIPLHDTRWLAERKLDGPPEAYDGDGTVSELFIARVVRVETFDAQALPLVYHRREYSTTRTLLADSIGL